MKPKELQETLRKLWLGGNRQAILVVGPPGIGKTEIVRQVADSLGFSFSVSHPVVADPTDYKGLPALVGEREADFLPYGPLLELVKADRPHIHLVDDLGQALPSVQAALMQLVLARRVGEHQVSPHVRFALATNRREDRAGVNVLLAPLLNRCIVVELQPSVRDWLKWAEQVGVHRTIIHFVEIFPRHLTEPNGKELEAGNTPRSIAALDSVYRLFRRHSLLIELVRGTTTTAVSQDFKWFLEHRGELPRLSDMVSRPESARVPENPAARTALARAVVAHARETDEGEARRLRKYVERLGPEAAAMYDAERRYR